MGRGRGNRHSGTTLMFPAMLSHAALQRLQEASLAVVTAPEDSIYQKVAQAAFTLLDADAVALWEAPSKLASSTLLAAAEGRQKGLHNPVALQKSLEECGFNPTPLAYIATESLTGEFRSVLAVALQASHLVLPSATLIAYSQSERDWYDESEASLLLNLFAPYVAQRLEEARLRARLARSSAEAWASCEIARHLASSTRQETLLRAVIARLTVGMGAKHGAVMLTEHKGSGNHSGELKIHASYGFSDAYIARANAPEGISLDPNHPNGKGPASVCVRESQPSAIPDVFEDENTKTLRSRAMEAGYRSILCVPLCSQGNTHGCIALYFGERCEFATQQMNFAFSVADGIALALERLSLSQRLVEEEVTQRSQSETDRLKSEFVSTVSHELRTPLTIIKGYTDLLVAGQAGELPETPHRFLVAIQKNTTRLTELVSDLLDISQMEQGKLAMTFGMVDMGRLLAEACTEYLPVAEQRDVVIEYAELQDERLPLIVGDAKRLAQVINNLLSNAVKYSPPKERVTLSCTKVTENGFTEIEVRVRDRGEGVPEAARENLFEKFYRVDSSLSREVGGTGLGLAIAKAIVEQHRGSIWIEDADDAAGGSIFVFALPVAHLE